MKEVALPGGLKVWALNATDAGVLHEQIFVNGAYAGHGITLGDGDCVVDAGANIGLASLWFSKQAAGLRQVAIEPIPDVFEALKRNVPAHVTAVNCALAEAAGQAELTYDPFVSSTGSLGEAPRIDPGALAKDLGVPRFAAAGIQLVRRLARRKVTCTLRTLSDVIAELGLERIDLLKLDVEGAEARVLAGIADSDWPKIRQAVVETSDAQGIEATLRARGFSVVKDQEPFETFKQLGLYNLYARRTSSARDSSTST
jgi:FkbM family methyltransferase